MEREQDVPLAPKPGLSLLTLSSCLDGEAGKGGPIWPEAVVGLRPPCSNTQAGNQLCRLIQSFNQQQMPTVCKLYNWDDHRGL